MKDFLGNELAVRDFIVLDSYTGGGHQLRLGIIYNVDESKGTIKYILCCRPLDNTPYYMTKHTTVMERVLRVHSSLIPNTVAAGLWTEVNKLV